MAIAVALLAVGGALVAPAAPQGSSLRLANPSDSHGGWINVSAVGDYGYSPPTFQQVATHANITVTFTDQSQMEHSFTIIGKQGWVVPNDSNMQEIDNLAYGHSPPALVNLNVTGPGDTNVTNFTSPGPGWYEFLCTVTGHFQLGMYGFIAFGMNLPSNLTTPSRTGVGGGLTFTPADAAVIAAFLAVVGVVAYVWRRRQLRRRSRT